MKSLTHKNHYFNIVRLDRIRLILLRGALLSFSVFRKVGNVVESRASQNWTQILENLYIVRR